jgi:uncharacterized protein YjiS (DUF1127 family)
MYRERIARLEQQLKDLDEKILLAESETKFDKDTLKDMTISRLDVYSTLRKYKQLQWEEDHERIDFEDDR